MSDKTNGCIPPAALAGSMRDFRVPGGADLLKRTEGFFQWQNLRRQNGLWPFLARRKMVLTPFAGRKMIAATRCAASILLRKTI